MHLVMKILLTAYVAATVVEAEDGPKCSCGVFRSPTPDRTSDSPILMKSPNFPIHCETDGKQTCSKMCMALAEAARESGPKVLCETVGTTFEPFAPLIYSKACGETEWVNTGLSTSVQVCCADSSVVPCEETN